MYIWLHVKRVSFLSNSYQNVNVLTNISKIPNMKFLRIHPAGVLLLNAGTWTERHKENNSCFSQMFHKYASKCILNRIK